MSEYFPEPTSSAGKVKAELDLSNYVTKADFKNVTGVDTSKFAKKVDLANLKSNVDINELKNVPSGLSSLKSKVDKLHIGKLETSPVDLSTVSTVVKNNAVKKIKNIEDKIPDIKKLATKTTLMLKQMRLRRNA